MNHYLKLLICLVLLTACSSKSKPQNLKIKVAAERIEAYLPKLQSKKIGLIVNHTSMVNAVHLIDFLIEQDINIQKVFTPEHGLKGIADAGELVGNTSYKNIPIVSLYGKNKKPKDTQVKDLDLLVFDIQDVGARFYTYISTMHYCMEAAAANKIDFMVLDRPNPNGHYIDGPVNDQLNKSFVAMHPIPIVHGLTVGELALMINGEKWLKDGQQCNLSVIECEHYSHEKRYALPVKPSPNLPNMRSIYLYPSLCLFEGTQISVGRGTAKQFQIYGHPDLKKTKFNFTPESRLGAKYPKLENKKCYGEDFSTVDEIAFFESAAFNLHHLVGAYMQFPNKESFFKDSNFFDLLAGNATLKEQIINQIPIDIIKLSWQDELIEYKKLRKKYLLYADF